MPRRDGRLIKSAKPFVKLVPYIMNRRSDAQIFVKEIVCTDIIDEYLHEKHKDGFKLSYMHLFIAVYVRIIAERPQLNRFVMNNRLYARKGIYISMVVKPSLDDESQETTVKFSFSGRENIFEIAGIVDKEISEISQSESQAEMDRIASGILAMPGPLKNLLVAVLKGMDRHNILSKSIIEVSPFHTSLFFSYLKSIKMDYVYHHLYDFGTTGIFAALGKIKKLPVVEEDKVVIKNCCEIGYTFDERICDGLYLVNSLKHVQKYLKEPRLLETGLEAIEEDII